MPFYAKLTALVVLEFILQAFGDWPTGALFLVLFVPF